MENNKDFNLSQIYGDRGEGTKKPVTQWELDYAEKLSQDPNIEYTKEQLLKIIWLKLNQKAVNGIFKPTEIQSAIMNDLFKYFMGKEDTPLDVKKGVLLIGSYGAGKTEIMRAFCTTQFGKFNPQRNEKACVMTSAIEMVDHYNKESDFNHYYKNNLYIDDFGSEQRAKYMAKDAEPILTKFLELWYMKSKHKLYITTNATKEELQEKYGGRVFSRLHQLCTFTTIKERDFRV